GPGGGPPGGQDAPRRPGDPGLGPAPALGVIVVGGGNAALCAALAAREQGAQVLLLEKAPEAERGGNSLFTGGGFRFAHQGLEDLRRAVLVDLTESEAQAVEVPPYPEDAFYDDLMRLTEDCANPDLADLLVRRSRPTIVWMRTQGIRWILMFNRQSYRVGDRHRFRGGLHVEGVGGGHGLVQSLYDRAARAGVEVWYGTGARRLLVDRRGAVTGVVARGPDGFEDLPARAVVLACGGFEANPEWRTRYLGPGWELARVRGTRHNVGDGIRMAPQIGAPPHGHWSSSPPAARDLHAPHVRR